MKKLILPAALMLPLITNAQSSDTTASYLGSMIIGLLVSIGIFLALRQVALWYLNINKIVENQEITNHLLDKNNKLLKEQVELLKSQIELTVGPAKPDEPALQD